MSKGAEKCSGHSRRLAPLAKTTVPRPSLPQISPDQPRPAGPHPGDAFDARAQAVALARLRAWLVGRPHVAQRAGQCGFAHRREGRAVQQRQGVEQFAQVAQIEPGRRRPPCPGTFRGRAFGQGKTCFRPFVAKQSQMESVQFHPPAFRFLAPAEPALQAVEAGALFLRAATLA
ncbi:MAG TPA: hypothetical protein VI457_07630 [Methylococcaceae bacterium]|nr:hypothetical protein [Methylococcaceae bacterium]